MGMLIPARMKDGTAITLRFEDKGDSIPGYHADATSPDSETFKAYTSWFTAESDAFKGEQPEIYSQVSQSEAQASGNEAAFRQANDDLCLERIGVDLASLDLDSAVTYES